MNIKTYEPSEPALAKYVQFYYELELNDEAYYAYPSQNNVVCFFNDANIAYSKNQIFIEEDLKKQNRNTFIALNKLRIPLFVKSEGTVKEFVITFKPHGLAQFITTEYSKLPFFELLEFNDFKKENTSFFEETIDDKIDKIEKFLLSKLEEKKDVDIVSKSLALMEEDLLTINEIADKCCCSYKKLYRLFLLHCGATPTVIKKNIRFRNVLQKIEHQNTDFKLSDVAFEFGYYDQAFFNNAFKKLTGVAPKKFFKDVTVLSKNDIYFKSIK